MSRFIGVFRHEFNMSIRRSGMWIAYGLLFVFYTVTVLWPSPEESNVFTDATLWQLAGQLAYTFNLFLPVAAGILAADRMQRDFRGGVHELQSSTPLSNLVYILGKYFGVLAASLAPILVWILVVTACLVATGNAPINLMYAMTVTFFAMIVPAFAFVIAFSLACPLIMPLRVYQILFTGYWFWGNYIPPEIFPTLNGTLLTAGGMHAYQGYFGGFHGLQDPLTYTATDATLNLLVLGLCIAAAMTVLNYYLQWQSRRA